MFGQWKGCPKFSLSLQINNTNPHYVWIYLVPTVLMRVCLFKYSYELHKERAAHLYDK